MRGLTRSFLQLVLATSFQEVGEVVEEEPEVAAVTLEEEDDEMDEEVKKIQNARKRTEEVRKKLTEKTVEALELESSGQDKDILTSLQGEIKVLREESAEAENELLGLVEVDEKDKPANIMKSLRKKGRPHKLHYVPPAFRPDLLNKEELAFL